MHRALLLGSLAALAIGLVVLAFVLAGSRARPAANPAPALAFEVGLPEAEVLAPGSPAGAGEAPADESADPPMPPARAEVAAETPSSPEPSAPGGPTGFRGRVVDSARSPAAACAVRIYRLGFDVEIAAGAPADPVSLAGETSTRGDGTFLVEGIFPRGLHALLAGVGTNETAHCIVQHTPNPGEVADLGDVVLAQGAIVAGVVRNEAGEPVPGATVRGLDLGDDFPRELPWERLDPRGVFLNRDLDLPIQVLELPAWVERGFALLPMATVRTDAQGEFHLAGLAPGDNQIAVNVSGYVPYAREVVALQGEPRDLGEIVLERGARLAVAVVDSRGAPVVCARVVAGTMPPEMPMDFAIPVGETDGHGRFDAQGFPQGQVSIAARRPGQAWVLAELPHFEDEVTLVIPDVHTLTVELSGTGADVLRDVQVELLPAFATEFVPWAKQPGLVTPIDLSYRLKQPEPGRLSIANLSPGLYVLQASAAGHGAAFSEVSIPRDALVKLRLPGKRVYTVRVLDPLGEPLPQASIAAQAGGSWMAIACGRTDREGRVEIDEIIDETILLTAEHPSYGTVHAQSTFAAGEVLLHMREPGSIEGRVNGSVTPAEGGRWVAMVSRPQGFESAGAIDERPVFASPDPEGAFVVRGLPPGAYDVAVVRSFESVRSVGELLSRGLDRRSVGQALRVHVAAGQSVSVALEAGFPR